MKCGWGPCVGALVLSLGTAVAANASCQPADLKGSWSFASQVVSGSGGGAVCIIQMSASGEVSGKRCFSADRRRRDLGKPFGTLKISSGCDVSGSVGLTFGGKTNHFVMDGKLDKPTRRITGTGTANGRGHTYSFRMTR